MATPDVTHAAEPTLADYVQVVRRHKWIILACTVLVPLLAFGLSAQKPKIYSASAEVLLSNNQDLLSGITDVPSVGSSFGDPERHARTQAALARVPEVARRAITAANVGPMFPYELLEASTVSSGDNDLLQFRVSGRDPEDVTKLTTAYATAFTRYRLEQDTTSLVDARRELLARAAELREQGATDTDYYVDLVVKAQNLRTYELLLTPAKVVRPAVGANKVSPNPVRDAMMGSILGLFLGLGIAFAWNALDKRVRSTDEVESVLGIPLLARLPAPPGDTSAPAMLVAPNGPHAESIRRLRTALELTNIGKELRTLMVTSPSAEQGKSTTVANLAVALARSGKSVALIDLDLRQPMIATMFGLQGRPGVTDVALGRAQLEHALTRIRIPVPGQRQEATGAATHGRLHVLPSGPLPPGPGEFVGTPQVTEIVSRLRAKHDYVLVDAPPMLAVDDALTISTYVDGIFAVVRLKTTHRTMLRDFARSLRVSPATVVGFAMTDAQLLEQYGTTAYGYGYGDRSVEPSEPRVPSPPTSVTVKTSNPSVRTSAQR